MKVEKRDKRIVEFDDSKIEAAITKAFESAKADTGPVRGLTKEVVQILQEQKRDVVHIEEIQDMTTTFLTVFNGSDQGDKKVTNFNFNFSQSCELK